MKNKKVKALLAVATTAFIVIGAWKGYCSLKIDVPVENTTEEIYVENSRVADDIAKGISASIETTDFKDKESIENLGTDIADAGKEVADTVDGTFEEATLVRVVDGDTIVVNIDNEGDVKVRLIGINTPESVASEEYLEKKNTTNSAEGKEASEFTKELLADVDVVYLQKDTSDTDRYDRLLRYVWIEIPDDKLSYEEVSEKMVNGILVREGYAEAVYYKPDGMYKDYFEQLEEEQLEKE